MTNSVQTVQYPYRTFTRPKKDRVVAGVAAGLSQQLRVDVLLVRLVLVFFALLSGAGLLFYACLWIWTKPGDTSDGNAYISQDDVRIRTKHTLNRAGYLVLVVVAIAGALLSFSSLTGFLGTFLNQRQGLQHRVMQPRRNLLALGSSGNFRTLLGQGIPCAQPQR